MQNPLARLRFQRDHRWTPRRASDYLDSEMAPAERRRAEAHMRACPECRALIAGLRTMIAMLAALPGRPADSVAIAVLTGVHERMAGDDEDRA